MRCFRRPLFFGAYLATTLLVTHLAMAQDAPNGFSPQPSLPLGSRNAGLVQAPDWVVWREFYDSIEYYNRTAPSRVQELFAERAGLTSSESAAVLDAGYDYVQRLSLIDGDARTEVKSRFQAKDVAPLPPGLVQRRADAQLPPDPMSRRTADGKDLREAVVADGLVARVEQRRAATLQAHREYLARTIGLQKLAALDRWIATDVAPNVKTVTSAAPVPPPPGAESLGALSTNQR
jgi:hypothetical protein